MKGKELSIHPHQSESLTAPMTGQLYRWNGRGVGKDGTATLMLPTGKIKTVSGPKVLHHFPISATHGAWLMETFFLRNAVFRITGQGKESARLGRISFRSPCKPEP